ncbi:Toll/interleukin-1 receptor domain-containing protein [Tanacetum coccineum]
MASVQKSFKYDVFLSFRGGDTRYNFVSHLYKALVQHGIETYMDDEKIEKGKTIDNQLIKSIEDSRFYIIPTKIRNQSGVVGEAFKKQENEEAARKWRDALNEAGSLAGDESKLIQIIVDGIFRKICSSSSSVDEKLVGMETRIEAFLSSLELNAHDVRMIGIWGMGGGGKTTLARAIFDQISNQFEGKSFVENVWEFSKPSLSGLKKLQKQILMDVFSHQDITISTVSGGKDTMRQMLHRKKLLVVLDDVNDKKQLEALAGASNWFRPGSRIIITTRDEQVLVAHRVNFIHNFVHKINLLSPNESTCLFSRYAFGREIPIDEYKDLSGKVVKYADGLPLTVEVLGSFLCGQDEPEWKDAIERLKTIPLKETLDKLELSYMGLEADYKEIFLDVACILKGWLKDDAVIALESCGFHARNGLRVLVQKSLIKISKYGGTEEIKCIKLRAEDLHLKGLANLKKLRFLTVYSLNNESSGSEDDCYGSDKELAEVSQYLPNSLRFLRWNGYPFSSLPKIFQANNLVGLMLEDNNIVQLWESGEKKVRTLDLRLTPNLEILRIKKCEDLTELRMPTESLKLRSINPRLTPNLGKLCLINCHDLVELLLPTKSQNLRILKLNHSKLKTLCLGITPNLGELILDHCHDLVELHMPSESLKLRSLKLSQLKLRILKLGITPNLAELILEDCNDWEELHMPTKSLQLRSLKLSHLKLRILKLGITSNLAQLILEDCNDVVELHMLAKSTNLRSLKLSNSKLRILDLSITSNLVELILKDCKYLVELHMPTESLYLRSFKISHSNVRILHLGFTPDLSELILKECNDLVKLCMPAVGSKF